MLFTSLYLIGFTIVLFSLSFKMPYYPLYAPDPGWTLMGFWEATLIIIGVQWNVDLGTITFT